MALLVGALQWAEDDDPALQAARAAWDQLDRLLIFVLVGIALLVFGVCAVLLLREKAASLKRRLVSVAVTGLGCAVFGGVVSRMGLVWLVAEPQEAGGPAAGSGAYWIWMTWIVGAALVGIASVVGGFIIVGAEDL